MLKNEGEIISWFMIVRFSSTMDIKSVASILNMSVDELADVKMQMDLLDWDETFVQACFAKSDDEVKTIIESFRDQLKAAGIDRFEKYVKDIYEEDPDSVSFYD